MCGHVIIYQPRIAAIRANRYVVRDVEREAVGGPRICVLVAEIELEAAIKAFD
jgi:hypothetical protein